MKPRYRIYQDVVNGFKPLYTFVYAVYPGDSVFGKKRSPADIFSPFITFSDLSFKAFGIKISDTVIDKVVWFEKVEQVYYV